MINFDSFLLQNPWRSKGFTFSQYINRDMFPSVLPYLSQKHIIIITGARQVGKTTLMYQVMEHLTAEGVSPQNIFYFNLDDEELLESINNPAELVMFIQRMQKEKAYIFIDEVQRLPNPGLFLKYIYDLKKDFKIIVSGSSSLEIHSKLTEHLTGRKITFHLYPFSFKEFVRCRNTDVLNEIEGGDSNNLSIQETNTLFGITLNSLLNEFCIYGGYPEITMEKDFEVKKRLLKEIYNSYVRKDIKDFLRIENVSGFNRLVSLLSHHTGDLVNILEISSTLGIHRNTIEKYIYILEETFVFKRVRPFFTNIRKELSKMPKVYAMDNGIRNAMVNNFSPIELRPDNGKLIETLVWSELIKSSDDPDSIRYWRTQAGSEVDFIVNTLPIEVKYSNFKSPKIQRSLKHYIEQYKPGNVIVVTKDFAGETYEGEATVTFVPVYLMPWIERL